MLGMMGDRKKAVADIVLMLGQKMDKKKVGRDGGGNMTEEVSNEDAGTENSEQMRIIAEDMMKAFEDKSVDRLASVLSAFASCCGGNEESGESEEY